MVYVNAYIILDSERQYTDLIPWSKQVEYGLYYGFTSDQIDWLTEICRKVDTVIVNERRSKQNGNVNKSGR